MRTASATHTSNDQWVLVCVGGEGITSNKCHLFSPKTALADLVGMPLQKVAPSFRTNTSLGCSSANLPESADTVSKAACFDAVPPFISLLFSAYREVCTAASDVRENQSRVCVTLQHCMSQHSVVSAYLGNFSHWRYQACHMVALKAFAAFQHCDILRLCCPTDLTDLHISKVIHVKAVRHHDIHTVSN